MIDSIISFSLRHRLTILFAVMLAVVGGLWSAHRMNVDVFPDLTSPQVVVMADCHGMATEEVEQLVTYPIETAINGAMGVRRVRSLSTNGVLTVWVDFDWDVDTYHARQVVSEKMSTLGSQLPEGITPVLTPPQSIMGEVLLIGLRNTRRDNSQDLRGLADWMIKPALLATGGIAQVSVIGGEDRQFQVWADPLLMRAYGVTLEDLETALTSACRNSEGGVIRSGGNEYALRGVGRVSGQEAKAAIENTLVTLSTDNYSPITVGDVATVTLAAATPMGTASIDGEEAVILSVAKQLGTNTLQVTRDVENVLATLQSSLPAGVQIEPHLFRQADFIESAIDNLSESIWLGALLCVIVLYLFLRSWRTTAISIIAIPLSLLCTLIALHLTGTEINTMTLGGLCIAIGSLVDDAIIDVENVYRRLREKGRQPSAEAYTTIVYEASREIRSSILSATLIVMAAFLPLFFLTGMEGRMLIPLGVTYIIALAMSLLVAMTVTPLLCRQWLPAALARPTEIGDWAVAEAQTEATPAFVTRLQTGYIRSLRWALENKRTVLWPTGILFVISLLLLSTFGRSFLPDFNEGALTIQAFCPAGSSLMATDEVGRTIEQRLHRVPEVQGTSRRTGRGDLDEHSSSTNSMEIDVRLDSHSHRSKQAILDDIRHELSLVPGVNTLIGQPISHRIDHIMSGTRAGIAVKVFGSDLATLQQTAANIKAAVSNVQGLTDLQVEQQALSPQIQIRPRRVALAAYGISLDAFHRLVTTGIGGQEVGQIYEGSRAYDLLLRFTPTYTSTLEGVRSAWIDSPVSGSIPLLEVCDVVSTHGPAAIARENVQRVVVLAANASGRDVVSVVNDMQRAIEREVVLPQGYRVVYSGQFESAKSATQTLLMASLFALLLIIGLLFYELRSLTLTGIVLAGLPLSVIGGVWAIFFSSGVLDLPALIGFITLFGIATRGGLLLISRFRASTDGDLFVGCRERLTPILMTALSSALALLPLACSAERAGAEIQTPLAIVVIGGLLSSTFLTLYIIPILYDIYQQRQKESED